MSEDEVQTSVGFAWLAPEFLPDSMRKRWDDPRLEKLKTGTPDLPEAPSAQELYAVDRVVEVSFTTWNQSFFAIC